MARIEVKQKDTDTFEITVTETTTTTHLVTLSQDYYQKLTGSKVSPETLLEKSFEFLLERESNTIFPEYEKNIVKRF
jgi:hypothetical protein